MKDTHIKIILSIIIAIETIAIILLAIAYSSKTEPVFQDTIVYNNIDSTKIFATPLQIKLDESNDYVISSEVSLDESYYQLFVEVNTNDDILSKIGSEYKIVIYFGEGSPETYNELYNTKTWRISIFERTSIIDFNVPRKNLDPSILSSLDSVVNGTELYAYCKLLFYDANDNLIFVTNTYIE